MKKISLAIFVVILLLVSYKTYEKSTTRRKENSASVYYNGDILTMEGQNANYAEAVVVKDAKITFTGHKAEAIKQAGEGYVLVDLEGKTMMPGFVEPHVHPSIAASILPNEIIAPYDWVLPTETQKGVIGHDAYIKALTESIQKNAKAGEVYWIWGYHQLWHGDLNRDMLNKISPDKPIAVLHRSFHEVFLNDKSIELMKIKKADFKGNPQVEWERGHFFEGGWLGLVPKIAQWFIVPSRYSKGLVLMTQLIRKNGITTIAEPGFPSSDFNMEYSLLKKEMDKNPPYSVYLIPSGTQLYSMKGNSNEKAEAYMEELPAKYNTTNIMFLPKQVKLFSDGAIYSQLMRMEGGYTDGHQGEWMTPLDLLKVQVKFYWDAGYKIHVHANGDQGIQQVLDYVTENEKNNPRKDHRFTLHHMGYFSDKQAQEVKDLGIEASVNPYYLWALADKYSEKGLGKERGENLVRIKSLTSRGVPVSFHSDFAMAPIEPLTLAWTAVNRVTSQNSRFSQDQRIDTYLALKGITITAARTLDLENEIGSIKTGKTADFTILSENPLKIDPLKIKDIKVIGTVYHGKRFDNTKQ
ncbi:amidohydrolase [[Flexibacter] sp. ATCC 35208]|uniref:amidohydrolase n=1 Tax=[Flexibacter] sp. ATCC 35208 TaxID=1936242 RepID=UPI0009CF75B3|nr:amidohydrolase [[Flexibacter] sp. ATCC 35208]OMP77559.1 metal-dependent hydrolase [[Flexibacter] sp. ATCC 35208]